MRRWLKDRLRDAPEAKNQIAFADVILLNKTDLVSDADLREIEARIRAINPYARAAPDRALHSTSARCSTATPSISTASSTSSRNSSNAATTTITMSMAGRS